MMHLSVVKSDLVLDVEKGSKKKGVSAIIYTGHGRGNQAFVQDEAGRLLPQHCASGLCLDVKGGRIKEAAPLVFWTPKKSGAGPADPNQCFKLDADGYLMTPAGGPGLVAGTSSLKTAASGLAGAKLCLVKRGDPGALRWEWTSWLGGEPPAPASNDAEPIAPPPPPPPILAPDEIDSEEEAKNTSGEMEESFIFSPLAGATSPGKKKKKKKRRGSRGDMAQNSAIAASAAAAAASFAAECAEPDESALAELPVRADPGEADGQPIGLVGASPTALPKPSKKKKRRNSQKYNSAEVGRNEEETTHRLGDYFEPSFDDSVELANFEGIIISKAGGEEVEGGLESPGAGASDGDVQQRGHSEEEEEEEEEAGHEEKDDDEIGDISEDEDLKEEEDEFDEEDDLEAMYGNAGVQKDVQRRLSIKLGFDANAGSNDDEEDEDELEAFYADAGGGGDVPESDSSQRSEGADGLRSPRASRMSEWRKSWSYEARESAADRKDDLSLLLHEFSLAQDELYWPLFDAGGGGATYAHVAKAANERVLTQLGVPTLKARRFAKIAAERSSSRSK